VAARDDYRQQRFDLETLQMFMRLAEVKEAGVMKLRMRMVYPMRPEKFEAPWFAGKVGNFKVLDANELDDGMAFGYEYDTVTINVGKYLKWLLNHFQSLGGRLLTRHVAHIDELISGPQSVIVNCTGFGARFLGGVRDLDVYPVRGQTVLVKVPHPVNTIVRLNAQGALETDTAYIIPRDDGTTLLGGTFHAYNMSMTPHPGTAERIIEACRQISPALNATLAENPQAQIIRHGVGLRPFRCNGIRMECERRNNGLILHHYGHGSWGYQSSWGSANAAVNLLLTQLPKTTSPPSSARL
jgi:glycine/D-amino acid oxidase-like deaminating enzyme